MYDQQNDRHDDIKHFCYALLEMEKFKRYHLEIELWKPIITKVEGKIPKNKQERRTLTNEV